MTDKLNELSAVRLLELQEAGEVSAADIIRDTLAAIEASDKDIHAYISVFADEALAAAETVDRKRAAGEAPGPLAGIPVAVKDNICMRGLRTTCGSRMLENYFPPYDATVVTRLTSAGAVIAGKTNMDEFAMGSSTETSTAGITANPRDTARVPGGSSGGSAAAVAARTAVLAIGSDTGGSIRQPAAFCGVTGLKPTYGRVSRYGLVAYASSLDQIGPFANTVEDCALLLDVLAGYDRADSTSADIPAGGYRDAVRKGCSGTATVGIPQEYFSDQIDPGVSAALRQAVKRAEADGIVVRDISLPHTRYAIAAYYLVASAEASSNLARYDGVKYGFRSPAPDDLEQMYITTRTAGFGPEVKRRIMLGTYALSSGYYDAYYVKALKVRTLIKEDFSRAFEDCDYILTPTAPTTAFGLGEKLDDPIQMYLSDICTISGNLAGVPGLSMPCGRAESTGMPVGLQLYGKHFDEAGLLAFAGRLEALLTRH